MPSPLLPYQARQGGWALVEGPASGTTTATMAGAAAAATANTPTAMIRRARLFVDATELPFLLTDPVHHNPARPFTQ